ncbi:MAG: amino acid ABC transporter substrate-binding protein [Alphaproteobacteria bacterium]|nr:amino acid ABC transporter substrate-binding protein [Alphaproteobacteria bacterium]
MIKKFTINILLALSLLIPHIALANVTIAVIAPKAGKYKKQGDELFNGAKLAINEINDNGGLNGKKLDILTIDDRCDDRLAISTAQMLSLINSKKIALVVGPYCSNKFDEIASIYETSKIFQIVPTTVAYNSGDIDKKGQIMFLGTKSQMSDDFFKFYNQNFAGLKTAFIYDDNKEDGYADVAKSLFDEFKRYGKSELLKFYTLNSDTNIQDLNQTLTKDRINISFILSKKDLTTDFIQQIKDPNMIIFTAKNMLSPTFFKNHEKNNNIIYLLALKSFKDTLMFTENLVDLRLHGIEPKGIEVYSYASVKLWSDIAKNIKDFDYDKLSKNANSEELKEKWSEFMMHTGSLKSSKYIIEMYNNGEFKQVY